MTELDDLALSLARIHAALSPKSKAVLEQSRALAEEIREQGADMFADDGDDILETAKDLDRAIDEVPGAGRAFAAADENTLRTVTKNLRHDLKNHIAALLGNLEMLEEDVAESNSATLRAMVSGLIGSIEELLATIDESAQTMPPTSCCAE